MTTRRQRPAGVGPVAAPLAAALAALAACVETVDLRAHRPVEPPSCEVGERVDPATGACAPCVVDEAPSATACPCGTTWTNGPFPNCEGDTVLVGCVPCQGDVTHCTAYDVVTGKATDCGALEACCAQLAADPSSKPCCDAGEDLVCAGGANLGQYGVSCVPSCCVGAPCDGNEGQCASWQTCDLSMRQCVPACRPGVTECGAGCTCEDVPQPG